MAENDEQDVQDLVDQVMADAQASVDDSAQDVDAATGGGQTLVEEPPMSDDEAADKIGLLGDVDLEVVIELGRTKMLVEDVLKLQEGSVVELDKLAGDPVDVYVNHQLVARGEVLVLNDNFCIRISEILADLEQEATVAAQKAQCAAE